MLDISIDGAEYFDEETNTFTTIPSVHCQMEHSLLAISKWESKYKKPFFDDDRITGHKEKTEEELVYYMYCMVVQSSEPVTVDTFRKAPQHIKAEILAYINDPMSATRITDTGKRGGSSEQVTSELIYYWMTASQVPVEFERWHINRLMNLLRICSIKNSPSKKMGKNAIAKQNHRINQERRARLGSKG